MFTHPSDLVCALLAPLVELSCMLFLPYRYSSHRTDVCSRALFEALLVLRKWGLLAAGVGFVDPLWSLVVAILCFCALWMGVVRVKPFATKGGQLHFRIAQTLLLILMVSSLVIVFPACV